MVDNKIPKIIHYCWFGGKPLLKRTKKCIASWKKYCPDYEIKEWNENNFDIHCCQYVEEAYAEKKWAFVADYARFHALYVEGGVYLETDTELLKPIDGLLENRCFFGFGNETMTIPCCGCEKNASVAKRMLEVYQNRLFVVDGEYNLTTVNRTLFDLLTNEYDLIHNNEFQILRDGIAIYPKEYFFSTDWATGVVSKNAKLYVIHYADGSWMTDEQKKYYRLIKGCVRIFGKRFGSKIGNAIWVLSEDGVCALGDKLFHKIRGHIKILFMRICNVCFFDKKKIVFENFCGKGYGDNPKYIAEEIIRQKLDYRMVWLVDKINKYELPKQICQVKTNTIGEYFALATAAFWVDNNRKCASIYKSKKQKYIQLWHGFVPLKKIEKDAEKSLTLEYIEAAKKDGELTDLMVSGCAMRTQVYKNSFWYKGEVLNCGTPRNDIFFDGKNHAEMIKSIYGISADCKILLYAPTFRDDHSINAYNLDFERVLDCLIRRFGGEWVCFVKLHPAVREKSKELNLVKRCVDVSLHEDINELFCASDFLISDYSDCMFEFSLTRKPVLLYACDLETYIADRDFYYDISTLPYDIVTNDDELAEAILDFSVDKYIERIDSFFARIECYEKGTASETVVNYIVKNTR